LTKTTKITGKNAFKTRATQSVAYPLA
jgi:hypothetical protein